MAESVANELVSQIQGQSNAQTRSAREEKKPVEPNEVKQSRPQKMMDFRNIKISQVGWYILHQMMFYLCHVVTVVHSLLKQLSFSLICSLLFHIM